MAFVRFARNRSIKGKILIMAVAFALPFAGAISLMIWEINRIGIDFARKELHGRSYNGGLRRLQELLAGCRQRIAYGSAVNAQAGGLGDCRARIEAAIKSQNERNGLHSEELKIGPRWDRLRTKISLLQQPAGRAAPEILRGYSEAIAELRELNAHVGDTSNLILDPDLDSYYLMDITLLRIPEVVEMMSLAKDRAILLASAGRANREVEKRELAAMALLIEDRNTAIARAAARAFLANPGLKFKLEQTKNKGLRTSADLVGVLKGEFAAVTPEQMNQTGTAAIAASFELYDRSSAELDALLVARIRALQGKIAGTIVLGMVGLGLALLVGLLISRSISEPIQATIDYARRISQGDALEPVEARRRDEAGHLLDAMNLMAARINGTISAIRQSVRRAERDSNTLADTTGDLSASAQEHAANAEEAAAATDEMHASIRGISKRGIDQASRAEDIARRIGALNAALADASQTMQELGRRAVDAAERAEQGEVSVGETTFAMEQISGNSAHIEEVIGIISDISEQTNLLALNASIEAARAGDTGRGFAVVATEISKLADRTAVSTKEIAGLIDRTVKSVENGSRKVSDTAVVLKSIIATIRAMQEMVAVVVNALETQHGNAASVSHGAETLATLAREIKMSAAEQERATREIGVSVEQISGKTQVFSSAAGRVAAVAVGMQLSVDTMRAACARFREDPRKILIWSSSFELGASDLDEQHQNIFQRANDLKSALVDGKKEATADALAALVEATTEHLRAEEQVLRETHYPDLEAHRAVHDRFRSQLQAVLDRDAANATLLERADEVLIMIAGWLADHILEVDREYAEHVAQARR